jgi:hypothetical protein
MIANIIKPTIIALLSIPLLASCASSPVAELPMKLIDGERHYFIKTSFGPCQHSRDWAVRTLTIRANEICKSEYVLVEQQTPITLSQLNQSAAGRAGDRELIWQIKCRNAQQPKS